MKNRDHPDYFIVEIDENTEKSSGHLRKLAFTTDCSERTPVGTDVTGSREII